jgi:hypothetical protein
MFTYPDRIGQLAQENHAEGGRNGMRVFDLERPEPVVHLASAVAAMRSMTAYLSRSAVRADAVFVSGLQRCDEPSAGQVRQAVAAAIRAFGCSGCAGRVAQEFGDHPETAVIRMRWARGVAREAFGDTPAGARRRRGSSRVAGHPSTAAR